MSRLRSVILGLSALMCLIVSGDTLASGVTVVAEQAQDDSLQVTPSAPHTTISWDDRLPDRREFELPLLYLRQQRAATLEAYRTLEINLAGLPAATVIQFEAVSHHVNVSTGGPHRVCTSLTTPDRPCTAADPCTIYWTLDSTTTHSDFYTLRVKDGAGQVIWQNPYLNRPDFVALDTWDVGLGEYTVRVTYATLFPFARGKKDHEDRLAPASVTDFIEQAFVPIIIDTWHTQVEDWGFGQPLHPDWDLDRVIDIIVTDPPFALFDNTGTRIHCDRVDGASISQCRMWWLPSIGNFYGYGSLKYGYRAVFAHEFFHLMQLNVLLFTERPATGWQMVFIEAQAKFAASVQYPGMEIHKNHVWSENSEYTGAANHFLTHRLNTSYRQLEAAPAFRYDAALYWRFLFEQYNDMGIIRAALEEMAYHSDADIVRSTAKVMDEAFARVDGPFRSFGETLVAFAQANYALRLKKGRCTDATFARCRGRYYDTRGVYVDPPLEAELDYDGTALTYSGAIPASYGMDFVEVKLDPVAQDRPLTIKVQGQGTTARFNVQVWRLRSTLLKPSAVTSQPEIVSQNADGTHLYVIPSVDVNKCDRLALIITRLDPDEDVDPAGNYYITLESEADVR